MQFSQTEMPAAPRAPLAPPSTASAPGLAAMRLNQLLGAMHRVDAQAEVRLRLPANGRLRMRDLVSRGAPRPTSRLRSLTMDRSIECESILEVEVAQILDACPSVRAYGEQPLELEFPGPDGPRRHIPDFVVLVGDRIDMVEVKYKRDVTREVLERTSRLQAIAPALGMGYRLVTELFTRSGNRLDNAQRLLRRAGIEASDDWRIRAVEDIRLAGGTVPLGYFGWEQTGCPQAGWIARLLIQGQLHADLTQPLSANSAVSLPNANFKENRLWPAAFN